LNKQADQVPQMTVPQKENITINTVLPGIVPTKIIPQAMLDAVAPDWQDSPPKLTLGVRS
jgi:NAD(P)-dependent dehydrogenase (short-subunit alcohol dehydrogenase family)